VFERNGELFRSVAEIAKDDYELLMTSGLYEELSSMGLLVCHEEVSVPEVAAYKILKPQRIPFVSYPHEWSFSQLKAAALLTLRIQRLAMKRGLSLKDATAFNVQFYGARAVFIDTLSFERYQEGRPWVAYRQFCEQFLAPLALMARCDVRLNELLRSFIDGVPLDVARSILGVRGWISPGLAVHVMLHAGLQRRYADAAAVTSSERVAAAKVSKRSLEGMLESLRNTVKKLSYRAVGTEWGDYYGATNYSDTGMQAKGALVERFIQQVRPITVWDLGANTGRFSAIAAKYASFVLACDIDPAAVEKLFLSAKKIKEQVILPIRMDLANPTSGYGWGGQERCSLEQRGPVDCVLALALIHHLAIGRNVPLEQVAEYFSRLAKYLIIEFVPKADSQVQRLLATREDVFPRYDVDGFTEAFSAFFDVVDSGAVVDSERIVFLLRRRP
jgi:ribosomal protein L11 methylase PrmA